MRYPTVLLCHRSGRDPWRLRLRPRRSPASKSSSMPTTPRDLSPESPWRGCSWARSSAGRAARRPVAVDQLPEVAGSPAVLASRAAQVAVRHPALLAATDLRGSGGAPPAELAADAHVLGFVALEPGAIGYVSANTPIPKTVRVLDIVDLDVDAVDDDWIDREANADGRAPHQPCRRQRRDDRPSRCRTPLLDRLVRPAGRRSPGGVREQRSGAGAERGHRDVRVVTTDG